MRNHKPNIRGLPIAAVAIISLVALGCAEEEPVVAETSLTSVTTPAPTGNEGLVAPPSTTDADALQATAGEIVRNPQQYANRVVTVTGEVEEVSSPRAFTIDTGLSPGELLVVSREPVPGVTAAGTTRDLLRDDDVIVTGRVLNVTIPDIEREIGWDLDREIEVEFENQPVLVVETMSATAGAGQN